MGAALTYALRYTLFALVALPVKTISMLPISPPLSRQKHKSRRSIGQADRTAAKNDSREKADRDAQHILAMRV
jgi:hypothetical protein